MENLLSKLINSLPNTHVIFSISEHMIRNSEMNATVPIRNFLKRENILDFDTISKGIRKNYITSVFKDGQIQKEEITFRSPPHKFEARMWIYNFKNYISPNEKILMTVLDRELFIIPLNQLPRQINRLLFQVNTSKDVMITQINELEIKPSFKVFKRDYIREALVNRKIGLAGELFVYQFEKNKLLSIGELNLSGLVEHKSVTEGDGLGYDILSYSHSKEKMHIEVKTTKGGVNTPFFMTPNEIEFYNSYPDSYYLYRVFDFDQTSKTGEIKVLHKDLDRKINFTPNSFRCNFK